jgi:ATPase family associated with various cellular activities (AAA)
VQFVRLFVRSDCQLNYGNMNIESFKINFLEKLNGRNNYDLFGLDMNEELHWGKLFIHLFGECYSRYSLLRKVNSQELIRSLIKRYSLSQSQILRSDMAKEENAYEADHEFSEVLLILKKSFMFGIINNRIELIYGSDISEAERNEVIKLVEEFKIDQKRVRKFHMIQRSSGYFELTDFDIKPFNVDIGTHYNDDFQDIHNLIIKSLTTKDKNGLVLLHGKFGSGKTYYLRHLITNVNRKFIYFPLNMIEELSSPEFLPFISHQPDSVLILEDCESLLVHRENGFNNASALSNLLNLGDGLLADALSVNVICTFNSGLKKIDDAILRKGRLLARYEFKELEISKARSLAQKIGKKVRIEHPMTVSDIYNLDEKSFENTPSKSVGFKAA